MFCSGTHHINSAGSKNWTSNHSISSLALNQLCHCALPTSREAIRKSPPKMENRTMARVYVRSIALSTMYQKAPFFLVWTGIWKISAVAFGFSSFKIKYNDYSKSLISRINRGHLLFWGEYQIYFIKCGEKISIYHDCVERVKMLIVSPHEMKHIWYLMNKKVNFLFILYSTEIQKALLGRFSIDLTFAACLLGIALGVNVVCT